MYAGLAISLVLHVGLLAWAVIQSQSLSKLPLPDSPTIEAEIITVSEFTRLKQGNPKAKKLEAKAKDKPEPQLSKIEAPKPKPKPKAEPPPAKPQSDPIADKLADLTPPPTPGPTPAELHKKLEDARKKTEKLKAQEKAKKEKAKKENAEKEKAKKKKAEARKRKERKRKAKLAAEKKRKAKQKKKKKFDLAQMKALLDKTPEKRGAPRTASEPTKPTDYTGPTAGEREGQGNQLTARQEDLLKGRLSAQLTGCWRLPGGGAGIETPVVTLRWRLRPDGSLISIPRVDNPRSDPLFKIAAEAAIRAVTQCAPFDLPPDLYNAWQTVIWDFDPRQML